MVSTAYQRFSRAIRFVYRLLLTTVLYSSGPVTPLIRNLPSWRPKKPRSTHRRAVSTRIAAPASARNPSSPVASTYLRSAYTMSALMWYWAVPAA